MNEDPDEGRISTCSDASQPRSEEMAEVQRIRESILAGYRDAIAGRMVEFHGDLRRLVRERSAMSTEVDDS